MAEVATNIGIRRSWTLLGFAAEFGKMQKGQFTNKETGEVFESCIFTHPTTGERKFVGFSSNLGVLSAQEIRDRKESLQVVELESGNYSLCNQGANSWEDVL